MAQSSKKASRPRVAIAGATGRVGTALIKALLSDPVEVLALTRNPDNDRLPPGIARGVVDFDLPSSLSGALHGADRLFLAHGTSMRQVQNEIALIDAAVAAGVSHVVKLSAMGPPTRLHPFDWHMQIEAHLAQFDIGYTVLRPSTFMDILARAGAPVISDRWGGAAGEGRVNLVDTRDVAEAARIALLDDRSVHTQRAYHLTGPGAVSMPDVADILSRLLGRSVTYQHRTPAEHREVLIETGLTEPIADLLLGLDLMFERSAIAETTGTLSALTGRKPRSVEDWLRDHIAAFAGVQTGAPE
ncbi:NmrA family NAD(P)-binding protein [Bradyrhizobium symbiodeficiens]|uniref:NmrA family NAD(P)-binding protein n=1 Tax=Bradyrhizobium symbiodeficiens TaxID=1404367 RepID=UPI0030CD26F5